MCCAPTRIYVNRKKPFNWDLTFSGTAFELAARNIPLPHRQDKKGGTMKYKSIIVTQRAGPEAMQVVEQELREPSAREVRIKALAVPVCLPDIQARYGQSPFRPRVPFAPGY